MTINKTILMAISFCNRSCPSDFNASMDRCLKTTSHYDVIAPSTVSTTQNAKLLPSPNLCHSLLLCHVTRSQHMRSVKHFGDPPVLVEPSRLRRNRHSCGKWIRRDHLKQGKPGTFIVRAKQHHKWRLAPAYTVPCNVFVIQLVVGSISGDK